VFSAVLKPSTQAVVSSAAMAVALPRDPAISPRAITDPTSRADSGLAVTGSAAVEGDERDGPPVVQAIEDEEVIEAVAVVVDGVGIGAGTAGDLRDA